MGTGTAVIAWLMELTRSIFKVCLRHSSAYTANPIAFCEAQTEGKWGKVRTQATTTSSVKRAHRCRVWCRPKSNNSYDKLAVKRWRTMCAEASSTCIVWCINASWSN